MRIISSNFGIVPLCRLQAAGIDKRPQHLSGHCRFLRFMFVLRAFCGLIVSGMHDSSVFPMRCRFYGLRFRALCWIFWPPRALCEWFPNPIRKQCATLCLVWARLIGCTRLLSIDSIRQCKSITKLQLKTNKRLGSTSFNLWSSVGSTFRSTKHSARRLHSSRTTWTASFETSKSTNLLSILLRCTASHSSQGSSYRSSKNLSCTMLMFVSSLFDNNPSLVREAQRSSVLLRLRTCGVQVWHLVSIAFWPITRLLP